MSSVNWSTETQNEITQRWVIFEANTLYSPVVVETLQTTSNNRYLFGGEKLFVKTEINIYYHSQLSTWRILVSVINTRERNKEGGKKEGRKERKKRLERKMAYNAPGCTTRVNGHYFLPRTELPESERIYQWR